MYKRQQPSEPEPSDEPPLSEPPPWLTEPEQAPHFIASLADEAPSMSPVEPESSVVQEPPAPVHCEPERSSLPLSESPTPTPAPASDTEPMLPLTAQSWPDFVAKLGLAGVPAELAANTGFIALREQQLLLALEPAFEGINRESPRQRLTQALSVHLGQDVRLVFEPSSEPLPTLAKRLRAQAQARQAEAEASFMAEPLVQSFIQHFGASVQAGSIEPLDPPSTTQE